MKGKLLKILLVLTCLVTAAGFAACGDGSVSSDEGVNSSKSDDTGSIELISAKEISHLGKTRVKQTAQTVVDGDGDEILQEAELVDVYVQGELCFLEYRLGEIENCLIQPVTSAEYNDRGVDKIVFQKTNMTTETISEGVSKSVSTTDSTSVARETTKTLNWAFGETLSSSCSVELGVGKKDVANFSASVEIAVEATREEGGEIGSATANEIASAVTKEQNENYDVSKTQEELTSMEVTYNMDEYEKGYWYALCMFANVEVFQVVAYNIETEEFYATYFLSTLSDTKGFRLVSSDNMEFKIDEEYQLKPITEIDFEQAKEEMYTIEYAVNGGVMPTDESYTVWYNEYTDIKIPTPKYSSYEEYNDFVGWYTDEACTEEFTEDLTKSPRNITLYAKWDLCTVYNNINETPQITCGGRVIVDWSSCAGERIDYIDAVNITGSRFGGGNNNFDIANTDEVIFIGNPKATYARVFICIVNYPNNSIVSLVFDQFNMEGFITPYNPPETLTLNVECVRNSSITASGPTVCSHAIYNFSKCNIRGGGIFKVQGLHGWAQSGEATNGIDGAAAIYAIGELTVDMDGGTLLALGGNGGAATSYDGIPEDSRDGYAGATGGAGMDAIKVTNMYVLGESIVQAYGGSGARGGDGEASRNKWWWSENAAGKGGDGGKGGAGICVSYIEVSTTAFVEATGGDGGNGGNGGTADTNCADGTPGVGGSGGSGEAGVIGSVNGQIKAKRGQDGATGALGGTYDSDP